MDEPLSALDRMTKEEILPYFEVLHSTLSIPVLYVTHDMFEIERLADHMVLIEGGRVVASGALSNLLADIRLPLAQGREASTILEARVVAFDAADGLTSLDVDRETLLAPGRVGEPGAIRRVRIAASDVSLATERPSQTTILNVVPVRIREVQPVNDAQVNVVVTLGHRDGTRRLLARVTRRAQRNLGLQPGRDAFAQIKAVSLLAPSR
jgi:molybdate transport system ATP-binding protein